MAAAGEASSKLLRFMYFVGAGGTYLHPYSSCTRARSSRVLRLLTPLLCSPVICTKAINTYRDYEHKKEASAAVAAAESALAAAAAAEPAPATAAAAKP